MIDIRIPVILAPFCSMLTRGHCHDPCRVVWIRSSQKHVTLDSTFLGVSGIHISPWWMPCSRRSSFSLPLSLCFFAILWGRQSLLSSTHSPHTIKQRTTTKPSPSKIYPLPLFTDFGGPSSVSDGTKERSELSGSAHVMMRGDLLRRIFVELKTQSLCGNPIQCVELLGELYILVIWRMISGSQAGVRGHVSSE